MGKQGGGYMWVYSGSGKGTTFKVYLPGVSDSIPASQVPETHAPTAHKGHETILLVEDEPAVRQLARMVLSKLGYTVLEALSPEDAERLAGDDRPELHLPFTDLVTPPMTRHQLPKPL